MTDHTADASNKVEPCACALCGSQERIVYSLTDTVLPLCDCLPLIDGDEMEIEGWNEFNRRILAMRRKDFEAGFVRGYFADLDDDPEPGMPIAQCFDDHIAKERGEDGK